MPPIPAYQAVAVKALPKAPMHRFADDHASTTSLKQRKRAKKSMTVLPTTKSLNASQRHIESQRITTENEALLKRLQQQNSVYNVYDWEHQAKKQVRYVKSICYHPPSLLKTSRGRKKSTRRGSSAFDSVAKQNAPNRQLYELY